MSRVSILFHLIVTEDAVGPWSVGPCAGELSPLLSPECAPNFLAAVSWIKPYPQPENNYSLHRHLQKSSPSFKNGFLQCPLPPALLTALTSGNASFLLCLLVSCVPGHLGTLVAHYFIVFSIFYITQLPLAGPQNHLCSS